MNDAECWAVYREREHSPGREADDAEILRLTGKQLEARGFQVAFKTAEELTATDTRPRAVFLMCERPESLRPLQTLETAGIPHVNSTQAVLNTYRERMIAQLREANVPFIDSAVMSTDAPHADAAFPAWLKRADVHNTQDGDVVYVDSTEALRAGLQALAHRGIPRAVVQPHIDGDLVKFYGVGAGARADGAPPWFRWFYHREQRVAGHAFDARALGGLVRRAATALGLEVYGGDAIVTPTGALLLLDVNAWPSFALYREEAADHIAAYLALRFTGGRS